MLGGLREFQAMVEKCEEVRQRGRELLEKMESCSGAEAEVHANAIRALVASVNDNLLFPNLKDLKSTLQKKIKAAREREKKK